MLVHTHSHCQCLQRAVCADHSVPTLFPSGFCPNHSTETALLEIAHDFPTAKSKVLINNNMSGLIFYTVTAPGVQGCNFIFLELTSDQQLDLQCLLGSRKCSLS